MSDTSTRPHEQRDWKRAYYTAMTTRDDRHFYENIATATELAGMRQTELVEELKITRSGSPRFLEVMDELEAIADALHLLKAYYESQALEPFAQAS